MRESRQYSPPLINGRLRTPSFFFILTNKYEENGGALFHRLMVWTRSENGCTHSIDRWGRKEERRRVVLFKAMVQGGSTYTARSNGRCTPSSQKNCSFRFEQNHLIFKSSPSLVLASTSLLFQHCGFFTGFRFVWVEDSSINNDALTNKAGPP